MLILYPDLEAWPFQWLVAIHRARQRRRRSTGSGSPKPLRTDLKYPSEQPPLEETSETEEEEAATQADDVEDVSSSTSTAADVKDLEDPPEAADPAPASAPAKLPAEPAGGDDLVALRALARVLILLHYMSQVEPKLRLPRRSC